MNFLTVGSRVIFSPPFPRCRYTWGTVVDLNLGIHTQHQRDQGVWHTKVYMIAPPDCYLVKLPSGLVISVRRDRCKIPDAVTQLGWMGASPG